MIRFEDVSKRYARSPDALSGVSFRLGKGEMAFLTGHSGAGKSTLLRLVGLVERPTRGRVEVGGGLPDGTQVVAGPATGLREGRRAKAEGAGARP